MGRSRNTVLAVLVLVLALSAGAASAQASSARPATAVKLASITYDIQNLLKDRANGKKLCLDADANGGSSAAVNAVDCNGSKWQVWTTGQDSTFHTIVYNTGHSTCLDSTPGSSGSALTARPCNGAATQHWALGAIQEFDPIEQGSLAVDLITNTNGHRTYVKPLNRGYSNQNWYFQVCHQSGSSC